MALTSGPVTECALCGSPDLKVILDLGSQPLAERFDGHDVTYPLAVAECGSCSLAQLTYAVDPAEVFPENHPYTSSGSSALRRHFADLTADLERDVLSVGDLAVDIGANDGLLLSGYTLPRCVAVEPTGQAAKCRQAGYRTWQAFFTPAVASDILSVCGPAKVVTATNVMAHVPDPHSFAEGVRMLLAGDGRLIAEVHDFASVVRGLQYDSIYHEHKFMWSVATLSRLLAAHGLEVMRAERIPTHGGSFRLTARLAAPVSDLQARADDAAGRLLHLVLELHDEGRNAIYGIGATTRAVPLIHFACLDRYLSCVCEVSTSEKIGSMMPGTQVPVVDEAKLIADQPPYALLLSHHMADVIVPALRAKGYSGRFITPLPEPKILND